MGGIREKPFTFVVDVAADVPIMSVRSGVRLADFQTQKYASIRGRTRKR